MKQYQKMNESTITENLNKSQTRASQKQEEISKNIESSQKKLSITEVQPSYNAKTPNLSLKLSKIATLDLGTNANKALSIMTLRNYLNKEKRLPLILSNKKINNLKALLKENIIKEQEELFNSTSNLFNKYKNDSQVESLINKVFAPSKTAQNGLNFVTKDEEINLSKKDQPEEILNIFRLIYILVNHEYSALPTNKLIENLLTNILPKNNIDCLKKNFF